MLFLARVQKEFWKSFQISSGEQQHPALLSLIGGGGETFWNACGSSGWGLWAHPRKGRTIYPGMPTNDLRDWRIGVESSIIQALRPGARALSPACAVAIHTYIVHVHIYSIYIYLYISLWISHVCTYRIYTYIYYSVWVEIWTHILPTFSPLITRGCQQ